MQWQDLVGFLSYLIIAAMFFAAGQIWLRVLAVSMLALECLYFLIVGADILWLGIALGAVFLISGLTRFLRPVAGDDLASDGVDMQDFHGSPLADLDPQSLRQLLQLGEWREIPAGSLLSEQGRRVKYLHLLTSGQVHVLVGGKQVGTMSRGAFIGEIAFLNDGVASATVQSAGPARCFALPVDGLRQLMSQDAVIRQFIEGLLARDLAHKLRERTATPQS